MTNQKKEIAKFICGVEAFHTIVHAYFWISGTSLTVLGITQTPTMNMAGTIVNALVAILLGVYAWRMPTPRDNSLIRANDKTTNT